MEIGEIQLLVEKAKEGEEEAFEQLMNAYGGFIYSIAYRMLGQGVAVDDIFQETFLRAWQGLKNFHPGGVILRTGSSALPSTSVLTILKKRRGLKKV